MAQRKDRKLSDSLLSATENGLHSKSHLDLTTREIAKSAGTNVAMINYYYNNKDGLFYNLVDNLISRVAKLLDQIEKDLDKNTCDPIDRIVRGLLEVNTRHIAAVHIVLVETLRPSSPITEKYSSRHGSESFLRISRIFQKLVNLGVYRKDLDAATATWLLVSLTSGLLCLKPSWKAMGESIEFPETQSWADRVVKVMQHELLRPLDRNNPEHPPWVK